MQDAPDEPLQLKRVDMRHCFDDDQVGMGRQRRFETGAIEDCG
jgi:histidyl-tRNA synthetase